MIPRFNAICSINVVCTIKQRCNAERFGIVDAEAVGRATIIDDPMRAFAECVKKAVGAIVRVVGIFFRAISAFFPLQVLHFFDMRRAAR